MNGRKDSWAETFEAVMIKNLSDVGMLAHAPFVKNYVYDFGICYMEMFF